jgi:hypothetical protein
MLKFLHNDKVSLGWAILVEIAVHALFAGGAFLLGGFLGDIALSQVLGPAGKDIGAWALAIFVFGAAFQAFVLGEYMREHVESFETTSKGNGSYIKSWQHVRWMVCGIELASLFFRMIQSASQGSYLQVIIVGVFGVLALWYAFAQAKVIHASVNRPVEYEVSRARETAGRSIVEDAMKYVPKMNAEQKKRFYTGDLGVIGEYEQGLVEKQQEKLQPKQERKNKEQARQSHTEQDMTISRGFMSKLLGHDTPTIDPVAQYPFLDAQSQSGSAMSKNGHHNN